MAYFLPEGYIERPHAPQSCDIGGDDTWQDEVYRTAQALARVLGLHTVVDYGCGSGFKLMKYFPAPEFSTLGVDLATAVISLRDKYPDRWWTTADDINCMPPQLLICSDVIEHVDDPDQLCSLIRFITPMWIVISTPDRGLMSKYPKWTTNSGPPGNGCHVREWNFEEFRKYMDSKFHVCRHWISNQEQCTQCVIARLR